MGTSKNDPKINQQSFCDPGKIKWLRDFLDFGFLKRKEKKIKKRQKKKYTQSQNLEKKRNKKSFLFTM